MCCINSCQQLVLNAEMTINHTTNNHLLGVSFSYTNPQFSYGMHIHEMLKDDFRECRSARFLFCDLYNNICLFGRF